MMKIFVLAGRLFCKNKLSNILMILLTVLTLWLSSIIYNQIVDYYSSYTYFKDTPVNNSVLYVGREGIHTDEGSFVDIKYMNEMMEYVDKSNIVEGVAVTYGFFAYNSNPEDGFLCISYDEITASYLKEGMSIQGKGLYEQPIAEPYPIVVYNSQYEIGEEVSLNIEIIASSQPFEGERIEAKKLTVDCVVVGTTTSLKPFPFFPASIKGGISPMPIKNLFGNHAVEFDEQVFFFPYIEELLGEYVLTTDNALIYFKPDASEMQKEEFVAKAEQLGNTCLGEDVVEKTRETGDFEVKRNFFMLLCFAVVSLVSIICVSFLNVKRGIRSFSLYYINGCTMKKSMLIYFTYFLSMYTVILIVYSIITIIQGSLMFSSENVYNMLSSVYYKVDMTAVLVVWVAGLVLSAICSLIPFLSMRKKSKIQLIKEK